MSIGHVDLKLLRHFVAVAETGSIRTAARQLNLSQPPLSRQIRRLEDLAGAPLFERTRRGVRLTEAGRMLLDRSRELIDQFRRMTDDVERVAAGRGGNLAIGYSDDFAHGAFPRAISALLQTEPDVGLSLRLGYSDAIVEDLLAGRLDVGFVVAPVPAHATAIETRLLPPVPLCVALPDGHRLARADCLFLNQLAGETFLYADLQPTAGFYMQVGQLWRAVGQLPQSITGIWPTQMGLSLVAAGAGVALLCRDAAPDPYPGVAIVPLGDEGAVVQRCIVWRRNASRAPLLRLIEAASGMFGCP